MASVEVVADGRKQRRLRRHHSDSRSRIEDDTVSRDIESAFDRPPDVVALREARLKSMATPAAARNKMKIEYQYTRPVKVAARVNSTRTSSSLFGRRAAVLPIRTKATGTKTTERNKNGDDSQYVYQVRDNAGVDRRDFQKEHDKEAKQKRRTKDDRTKGTTTSTVKPNIERRKTEPIPDLRRASTSAAVRPSMRKSTTTKKSTGDTEQHAHGQSMQHEGVTSTTEPTKSQRSTSVFGALFAKSIAPVEKHISCLTCGSDDIPESKSAKLPCTHRMCHSCLRRIFKMSVKDPAHMPPRCCTDKHISLKHVEGLFDQDFKKTWNRKFKEFNAKNKIYCPRRGCEEWIQPKHMRLEQGRKIGVCPKCHHAVCAICNQRAHKSKDCPKDPAMKQLTEIAEQQGWRKCFNCSAIVELKEGCNHMTCRCQAQFCMPCGLEWKTCDCPLFSYEAVGDLQGNPIRYQQEMDRIREQMAGDEEFARQVAGLGAAAFGAPLPGRRTYRVRRTNAGVGQ